MAVDAFKCKAERPHSPTQFTKSGRCVWCALQEESAARLAYREVLEDIAYRGSMIEGARAIALAAISPENTKRTCRAGHAYVTDAASPGRCWCGERAELTTVKESEAP